MYWQARPRTLWIQGLSPRSGQASGGSEVEAQLTAGWWGAAALTGSAWVVWVD